MNNIYTNLSESIKNEFKVFDLDEDVQFSLSKIDGYDLQINNLVKYNKENFFQTLQEKIIEIIIREQIFDTVDKNEIGFINLSLNHKFLINKITNTKNDFISNERCKIIFAKWQCYCQEGISHIFSRFRCIPKFKI